MPHPRSQPPSPACPRQQRAVGTPPVEAPAQPQASRTADARIVLLEALDDLERLVGLEDAKREINQQVNFIRIAQIAKPRA